MSPAPSATPRPFRPQPQPAPLQSRPWHTQHGLASPRATLSTLKLETSPVDNRPTRRDRAERLLRSRVPPPGWGPTCSSARPEHLQPQLGGPAQLLRCELGSGEEDFAARAQAGKHHHLARQGAAQLRRPRPSAWPHPDTPVRGEEPPTGPFSHSGIPRCSGEKHQVKTVSEQQESHLHL